MAIGGAIGVGLFLGSASAIRSAGPAVTLCYVLAGAVVFFMLRALGEMAMDRPVSGSFASYAGAMVGPWAGFVTACTYWLMWIVTVMAEITAIGIYVRYFFFRASRSGYQVSSRSSCWSPSTSSPFVCSARWSSGSPW
jgi:AAT family amino acid transporter/D-serine/D-alanine/glycine transporter